MAEKKRWPVHEIVRMLREERSRQGISLVGMEKLTGYSSNHIWQIEVGKQGARIDIVSDIAHTLGMKLKLEKTDER